MFIFFKINIKMTQKCHLRYGMLKERTSHKITHWPILQILLHTKNNKMYTIDSMSNGKVKLSGKVRAGAMMLTLLANTCNQ